MRSSWAGPAPAVMFCALVLTGDAAAHSGGEHSRPVALAVDAARSVVYVALSTANRLAAVDVSPGHPPRVIGERPICAHPTALAAVPAGTDPERRAGVLVSCRFDPGLRMVTVASAGGDVETRTIAAGPEHGQRGIAVEPEGRFAYVASAALGGVKVVELAGAPGAPIRFRATGLDPGVVRVVAAHIGEGEGEGAARRLASASTPSRPWLLVANRVSHTVTVHRLDPDGGVAEATQTIHTEAPVLDFAVTDRALYLLTYEDRPITRAHRDVEGLDSVVLILPRAQRGGGAGWPALPFEDPGVGRRRSINLSAWPGAPVVTPEAAALSTEASPGIPQLAVVGAGSDNLWISSELPAAGGPGEAGLAGAAAEVVPVGTNPSAVAFLPDGRIVTADRLSDSISVVAAPGPERLAGTATPRAVTTLSLGNSSRARPAELGEVLFHSRALVPNNTAAGPLSLYTCAACHLDGHVDGRRHPSKLDRFASVTKTCRGLAGTEPFLSLGRPATLAAFADNIVNTHAQGQATAPGSFDHYDVTLRLPVPAAPLRRDAAARARPLAWAETRVSAAGLRAALAAYLAQIPVEPSPFVAPGRVRLIEPERRGLHLFQAAGCAGCHRLVHATGARDAIAPEATLERDLLGGRVALTAAGTFDVGTPVLGAGGNNPPSLRGVWAAAPYFSDGSAATLHEVLARTDPSAARVHAPENARAGRRPGLSAAEQADLLAFLRAL